MGAVAEVGTADGFTARQFRDAAGQFASGVTVVTALDRELNAVRGMTANSFVSVSLDPPLVLVSLGNHARMLAFVRETGAFGVSVLSAQQQGFAQLFAGQARPSAPRCFTTLGGLPVVDGALAALACHLHGLVEAGDHTLVLGEVRELTRTDGDPLLFYGGHYRAVRKIDEELAYASMF